MIGAVIGIILALILLGAIIWGVQQVIRVVPMPEVFRTIINVVIVILIVFIGVWVVVQLLGVAGVNVPLLK